MSFYLKIYEQTLTVFFTPTDGVFGFGGLFFLLCLLAQVILEINSAVLSVFSFCVATLKTMC